MRITTSSTIQGMPNSLLPTYQVEEQDNFSLVQAHRDSITTSIIWFMKRDSLTHKKYHIHSFSSSMCELYTNTTLKLYGSHILKGLSPHCTFRKYNDHSHLNPIISSSSVSTFTYMPISEIFFQLHTCVPSLTLTLSMRHVV